MKREKLSKAAASGAVALIFLVLGFQAAIFTGNVFRYNREHRVDTVYVVSPGLGSEQTRLEALSPGSCSEQTRLEALSPGLGSEKASLRAREDIEPLFPTRSFSTPDTPGESASRRVCSEPKPGETTYTVSTRCSRL